MPDRGGRQALHRLCDSVSGANWRPTRFEDELTLSRYACCVCHVFPSTTVLLPCSHSLCEHCLTGSAVQDGGNVCPMDQEPFGGDECQMIKLPDKKKQNLKAHCWNEADGCDFVGTIDAVLLHFDSECAFHSLQCPRCQERILRTDIAAHYIAGCSQSASCASGAQPNRQDTDSTSCSDYAMLEKLSPLQRQMNGLLRTSDSARLDEIRREMKGIDSKIGSIATQQLNAGLQEVKRLIRDPLSDHLSSLQSQVNELVEQSRRHATSEKQELVRGLRDSKTELKKDVQSQSQLLARMLRDIKNKFKGLTAQSQEFVNSLKDSVCEVKEHVSKAEANLSSMLTDQQQSLQTELDSIKQNKESSETERPLGAVALGQEYNPLNMQEQFIPLKLAVFINETLNILEILRQQVHRHEKKLWVSIRTDPLLACGTMTNDASRFSSIYVTLGNAGNIFVPDEEHITVANLVNYRDMLIRISFESSNVAGGTFHVYVVCVKSSGSSSFPFTEITVEARKRYRGGALDFHRTGQYECYYCSKNNISHITASFKVAHEKLEDGVIVNDKLLLKIEFK